MDEIQNTAAWFQATEQLPPDGQPNKRWTAFYLGMQLEELAEKLDVIPELVFLGERMHDAAKRLRKAEYDDAVWTAFLANPKAFLDSDGDLVWVTIGAAEAAGANLDGAYARIDDANWRKQFDDGTFHLDKDGKVLKPEGWEPPDLTDFIHPSLKDTAA